jgi:hypothetical protein
VGDLTVKIPRPDGAVSVRVAGEKFTCDNAALAHVLRYIMLDTGHHADRDLELAQLAAKKLGGKVIDEREPNAADHGISR